MNYNRKKIKNRRYAALQKLRATTEYFSEEQMKQREPLMYEHLVAKYSNSNENLSTSEQSSDDVK